MVELKLSFCRCHLSWLDSAITNIANLEMLQMVLQKMDF